MYKVYKENFLKYYKFAIGDFFCLYLPFLLPFASGTMTKNNYGTYLQLALMIGVCFYFYILLNDAYKNIYCRSCLQEMKAVLFMISSIYGWVILFTFVLKTTAMYSRINLVLMYLLTLVLSCLIRCVFRSIGKKRLKNREYVRKGVIFTFSDRLDELENIITTVQENDCKVYSFKWVVVLDNPHANECKIPRLSSKEAAFKYIQRNVVDDVLIFANHYNELIYEIEETCISMGVVVHYVLGERKTKYPKKEIIEEFGPYKIVTSGINVINARQLFLKRLIDICGSLVGLLITGICFLFVAPMIYIQSPGPIFYAQTRVGANGRPFKIYKFRSMYPDAEKRKAELMAQNKMDGLMFKMDNDPRIIKGIGHFIRSSSIDELPQMWNVLKGDMSLVGTRPPTIDEFKAYNFHHKSRLAMKPGITGLWQISGRSEVTNFEDVVALDNQYISNWRMMSDVKILFKTVMVVIGRSGAV